MKIRCKKTDDDRILGSNEIIRVLTAGKEYVVLCMTISKDGVRLRIETDNGVLRMFPAAWFEMLTNYIPSNWEARSIPKIQNDESYFIRFAPKKWNDVVYEDGSGFFDQIVDGPDPLEEYRDHPEWGTSSIVELYLQERDIIYREEEEYWKNLRRNYFEVYSTVWTLDGSELISSIEFCGNTPPSTKAAIFLTKEIVNDYFYNDPWRHTEHSRNTVKEVIASNSEFRTILEEKIRNKDFTSFPGTDSINVYVTPNDFGYRDYRL